MSLVGVSLDWLGLIILIIMGLIESLQRRRAQGSLGAAVRT